MFRLGCRTIRRAPERHGQDGDAGQDERDAQQHSHRHAAPQKAELRIRFAKARDWFSTPFSLQPGPRQYAQTARFAKFILKLKRDPYAYVMAGIPADNSEWESDAGAELPG